MSEALDVGGALFVEAFDAHKRGEPYKVKQLCNRAQILHEIASAPLRDGLEKIKSFVPQTERERIMQTLAVEALKGDKA